MTDKPKPCPRCGCTVSGSADYFFIPVENLRWHASCYRKSNPEPPKEVKEETQ